MICFISEEDAKKERADAQFKLKVAVKRFKTSLNQAFSVLSTHKFLEPSLRNYGSMLYPSFFCGAFILTRRFDLHTKRTQFRVQHLDAV
jgi:hypothetical protein